MQEQLICPYPGLRPFTEDESIFFKGREEHIGQIVKQLEEKKFLMLTGASGDGKSSLIYAGVIPNARAGFFKAKFNNWIVADFRPEREPLKNMAIAIAEQLKIKDVEQVGKELSYGFSSLIDLYKSTPNWVDQESAEHKALSPEDQKKAKRKGANLLILVDQFEEFFTNPENYNNGKTSIESQAVVNCLLETTRLAIEQDVPIYIVCTMRSDYIGQCASFRGLPEYIGYSQFFVPRLKRKEIYQVIEEPAHLNGNKISKRLIEMLINEMNDGIDQLPVLQHALNQIWQKADKGQVEMDLIHFAKINGIPKNQLSEKDKLEFENWFNTLPEFKKEFFNNPSLGNVLDAHANELFETAYNYADSISNEDAKLIIETAFKCLTKIDESRAVRNRMTLEEVTQIINKPHITIKSVEKVLHVFRIQGNTFLRPFIFDDEPNNELTNNSVLDITHESLIRNWKKLTDWANDEYNNLLTWQDFNKQLQRWINSNKSSGYLLPIGPLTFFESWYDTTKPNKYWLARYDEREVSKEEKLAEAEKTLSNIKQFIKRSARRLFVNRTIIKYGADKIIAALGIVVLIASCTYFFFDFRKKQNDYVINDIQEKSKELLKSRYIKNTTKANYILSAETFNPGSFESLINELENDSIKKEVVREILINCLTLHYNKPENEPENKLIAILFSRILDGFTRDKIFENNNKLVKNINNINFVVYTKLILKRDDFKNSINLTNSKLEVFCNNTYESFIKLLDDTATLRKLNVTQFNKFLQLIPEIVQFDKIKLQNVINKISPFNSTSVALFNLIYPKDKSVKCNFVDNITHNSGYFQIGNLYAMCGDFPNLNRSFDSIIVSNKNYLNNPSGYSYNRLFYSLMVSNSFCSNDGIKFLNKVESKFIIKKHFSLSHLLIDRFLVNQGQSINAFSLREIFNNQEQSFNISTTLENITVPRKIEFIDFTINQLLDDKSLEQNKKYFTIALLYKSKTLCFNTLKNLDYNQIYECLNYGFEYYNKLSPAFCEGESFVGVDNNTKVIKNSELFKYPANISITDTWNTYAVWQSGFDQSNFMNYVMKNKEVFKSHYSNKVGIKLLNNFMTNYSAYNRYSNKNKFTKIFNLDFLQDILATKIGKQYLDSNYAYTVLTQYYNDKGDYGNAHISSMKIDINKFFSKDNFNTEDGPFGGGTYASLSMNLINYFAVNINSSLKPEFRKKSKQKVFKMIQSLPYEYLKRNALIVAMDSMLSNNMDELAIEFADTLLNTQIFKNGKFGNAFFRVLGRLGTKDCNSIAMNLLKEKGDKIKPSCLNLFIDGLLQGENYYEATTFIPTYVSSSNQLMLYNTFIRKAAEKNGKKIIADENGWTDSPLETGETGGNFFIQVGEE